MADQDYRSYLDTSKEDKKKRRRAIRARRRRLAAEKKKREAAEKKKRTRTSVARRKKQKKVEEARALIRGGQKEKKSAEGWENMYIGLESGMGKLIPTNLKASDIARAEGQLFSDPVPSQVSTLQLGRKYILATIKSGLLVIDQKRAHQRVLYERLLKKMTQKETISQQLLFPLALSYSPDEILLLKEMHTDLVDLGFSFEEWDEGQVTIKGIPPLMKEDDVGLVLDELISNYKENLHGKDYSQTDTLAKAVSKTMAVKNGEVLDSSAQVALVNDLFSCKEIDRSPFNKPIFVTISEKDIENKFN